jgi:hypothetical protein
VSGLAHIRGFTCMACEAPQDAGTRQRADLRLTLKVTAVAARRSERSFGRSAKPGTRALPTASGREAKRAREQELGSERVTEGGPESYGEWPRGGVSAASSSQASYPGTRALAYGGWPRGEASPRAQLRAVRRAAEGPRGFRGPSARA